MWQHWRIVKDLAQVDLAKDSDVSFLCLVYSFTPNKPSCYMFNKNWKLRSSSWWLSHPFEKYALQIGSFFQGSGGEKRKKCLKPPNQSSFSKQKKLCESFISKLGFSKWHRHISQANLLPYSCNSNPSKGQVETRCADELQEKTIRTLSTGSFTRFRCFRLSGAPGVEFCCCCFNFFGGKTYEMS